MEELIELLNNLPEGLSIYRLSVLCNVTSSALYKIRQGKKCMSDERIAEVKEIIREEIHKSRAITNRTGKVILDNDDTIVKLWLKDPVRDTILLLVEQREKYINKIQDILREITGLLRQLPEFIVEDTEIAKTIDSIRSILEKER